MREPFSFASGAGRTYVLARDVVFMKAICNTFIFVIAAAPLQGGLALGLALLINQRLRRINGLPHDLFHAGGGFHRRRLASVAVHL